MYFSCEQCEKEKLHVHHKKKKCDLTLFCMVEGNTARWLAAVLQVL